MNSNSETVREVCAEMRNELNQSWWDVDREKVHDIPDRILSAYEREMAAKDAEIAALKERIDSLIDGKNDEMIAKWIERSRGYGKDGRIELLERALKTVMECDTETDGPFGASMLNLCRKAIREAQRIMKEGEEK